MKVLILGGTSFFGKAIVRKFFEAQHSVTVFTRGKELPTDLPPHEHLKGDRGNLSDLLRVARHAEWDLVIDNIGYDGEAVSKAVEAFKGVKHFIFDSTVSVYRYIPDAFPMPLQENAVNFERIPPQQDLEDIHWKYARGKLEAERALKEASFPWTILRPPVVYGPFDVTNRGYWYLARLLDGGPILLSNGGVQSFRLAYSEDIAQAFLKAAWKPQTYGKAYFLGQNEVITLRDFIEESARALGVTPHFVSVPSEILGQMGGPHAPMVNMIPDISAAQKDLGFSPTPFSTFIRSTAIWFRDQWKGNKADLLKGREEEIAFAEKWKRLVSQVS